MVFGLRCGAFSVQPLDSIVQRKIPGLAVFMENGIGRREGIAEAAGER